MDRTTHLPNVDDLLRGRIDQLTENDDQFWSLPGHDIRDSIHALFQYPAMMVPIVQKVLIDIVTSAQSGIGKMIDPFVGAGTTLAASMYKGLDCYGQDTNPLAVLISRSKTGPFFHDSLVRRTSQAIRKAKNDLSDKVEVDFPNIYKWFRRDVAIELSKLKRSIQSESELWARRFMWVTLAETVRVTSNDRISTYKLHIRPAEEISSRQDSPIQVFSRLIKQNLNDMLDFRRNLDQAGCIRRGRFVGKVKVELGDTAEEILLPDGENQSYDLLITSPPYGDNTSTITYGQHSYLPLQWIEFEDIAREADISFLRTTQEIDRRSLGGRKSRNLKEQIRQLSLESEALLRTFQALSDKPRDRAARVAAFYSDFIRALDIIINSMAVNAYMIWTVGNRHVGGVEIPNDLILTELLERKHSELVARIERRIHQKRMPLKNQISKTMNYERILVFRKNSPAETYGELSAPF